METKQVVKIYKNGKTYEENVRSGVFLPKKALDNHTEVMTEIADLKAIVMKLLNNMDR
jgi:hypothetical protein